MKEGASVKIQRKIHKRLYLEGKGTYKCERLYLPIPKRFNELLKPYLKQKLNIEFKICGFLLQTKAYLFWERPA
jgi:hypothetical protein